MAKFVLTLAGILASASMATAQLTTTLERKTVAAFDAYIGPAESALAKATKPVHQVAVGPPTISPFTGINGKKLPGGLLHDWVGTKFIANCTPQQVVNLLLDYNHHAGTMPEVVAGKVVSQNGNAMHAALRIRKKNVLTVVLNTEYDVEIKQTGDIWTVWSRSSRIAEVDSPDSPKERELPPGNDHGYLWRMNAYWIVQPANGGSIVECRSISLSRDIPFGLGPFFRPFVRDLPRTSLEGIFSALDRKLNPQI